MRQHLLYMLENKVISHFSVIDNNSDNNCLVSDSHEDVEFQMSNESSKIIEEKIPNQSSNFPSEENLIIEDEYNNNEINPRKRTISHSLNEIFFEPKHKKKNVDLVNKTMEKNYAISKKN